MYSIEHTDTKTKISLAVIGVTTWEILVCSRNDFTSYGRMKFYLLLRKIFWQMQLATMPDSTPIPKDTIASNILTPPFAVILLTLKVQHQVNYTKIYLRLQNISAYVKIIKLEKVDIMSNILYTKTKIPLAVIGLNYLGDSRLCSS